MGIERKAVNLIGKTVRIEAQTEAGYLTLRGVLSGVNPMAVIITLPDDLGSVPVPHAGIDRLEEIA